MTQQIVSPAPAGKVPPISLWDVLKKSLIPSALVVGTIAWLASPEEDKFNLSGLVAPPAAANDPLEFRDLHDRFNSAKLGFSQAERALSPDGPRFAGVTTAYRDFWDRANLATVVKEVDRILTAVEFLHSQHECIGKHIEDANRAARTAANNPDDVRRRQLLSSDIPGDYSRLSDRLTRYCNQGFLAASERLEQLIAIKWPSTADAPGIVPADIKYQLAIKLGGQLTALGGMKDFTDRSMKDVIRTTRDTIRQLQ